MEQAIAFGPWWDAVNAQLANLGEPEALLGDARSYHTKGYGPAAAAQLIMEDRKEGRDIAEVNAE